MIPKQHILLNAVLFQLAWFSAALVSWQLAMALVVAVAVQLLWVQKDKAFHVMFVAMVVALGIVMDSLFAVLGVYVFKNSPDTVLGFPIWLMCMWLAFAMSIRMSLDWLFAKPKIFIVASAIMGPVSYVVGRNLDLIGFENQHIPWMMLAWAAWASLACGVSRLLTVFLTPKSPAKLL